MRGPDGRVQTSEVNAQLVYLYNAMVHLLVVVSTLSARVQTSDVFEGGYNHALSDGRATHSRFLER